MVNPTLTHEDLLRIASSKYLPTVGDGGIYDKEFYSRALMFKIVPKERPRSGRSGHFYTPKKTQDCEKAIQETCDDAPLVFFPVRLIIHIYEKVPKSKEEASDYIRPSKSDVDNKVKTITDALNGILYKDDNQISSIVASCRYATQDYATIQAFRDGLSFNEWENVRKMTPYV